MGLAAFNAMRRRQEIAKKLVEEKEVDYDSLTVNDLKQIAKDNNMEGYSNMKKEELIDLSKGSVKNIEDDK